MKTRHALPVLAALAALALTGCSSPARALPETITPGQPFTVSDLSVTVTDVARCEGEAQVSMTVQVGQGWVGGDIGSAVGLYAATVTDPAGVTRPVSPGSAVTYLCEGDRLDALAELLPGRTYSGQVYVDAPAGATVELHGSDGVTRLLSVPR